MGGHLFFVEFHREPDDLGAFARVLDDTIRNGNEDYATHRTYGLRAPVVERLPAGAFLQFMTRSGKVGGQHKVPRVLSDAKRRELLDVARQP
jgi:hypothetical protein